MPDPPNRVGCAADTEAFTTWLDHAEADPQHRWKAVERDPRRWTGAHYSRLRLWSSPDGVAWAPYRQAAGGNASGTVMDRASFFYNPFRRKWVFSLRENLCRGGHGRMRVSRYVEVASLRESDWPNWVRGADFFQCGSVRDGRRGGRCE